MPHSPDGLRPWTNDTNGRKLTGRGGSDPRDNMVGLSNPIYFNFDPNF